MSNTKTGFLSAFGALVGGALGATAGHYAAKARPSARFRSNSNNVEDAMVVGGAAGAVVGAFIGGAASGEPPPPPQLNAPSR